MEFVIEDTLYRIDESFVHPGGDEVRPMCLTGCIVFCGV
jgi:hypothetical protein